MDTILVWQLILQLVLIAFNAIFASAEIAIITMNDAKLAKLASEGNKKAMRLARLTNKPAEFLATIQVAITLAGFLGSAFAAENFSDSIVNRLQPIVGTNGFLSPEALDTIVVILITIVLSYVTLIFGELVPKRIAMKNYEAVALGLSSLICAVAKIFSPLVWLLTVSTNCVLRLCGIDPNSEDENVTEEEIRMMVDAGSEKGTIDEEEKELIQNVFEFDDLPVEEIATRRTEVTMLWLDETPEQWEETIHNSRHTIYPICEENVDNVVGTLDAKDYFRLKDKSKENILKEAVTQPYFVPGSVKADVLFKNMKTSKNYFAVVIDEYGGMVGIVTMDDLVQALVGDYIDEASDDDAEPDIKKLDDESYFILGGADIEDVEKELGIAFPDEEDCETFGGYVFANYGSVPEDGTTFEFETDLLYIKALEIKDHRLVKALVRVIEQKDDDNLPDGDEDSK